jgi:hypothetical protein|tara:strand:+ start:777 stop:1502 length:726 start_codon:yes stop_codon:yes gene_type:complete
MVVDLFLVYSFIRKLVTPFEKWDAYEEGIIDEKGNILISRKDYSKNAQKKAFGIFDQMVLNVKKLLGKLPGGQTKLASYAAALWLIREEQRIHATNYLTEESVELDLDTALERFMDENSSVIAEAAKIEEEPVNNVGGGNIAGVGVGANGEPGVTGKTKKKHKKRIRDIMGTINVKEDAVAQAQLKARQASEADRLKDEQEKAKEQLKLKHDAEVERQRGIDEVEKTREAQQKKRDAEQAK